MKVGKRQELNHFDTLFGDFPQYIQVSLRGPTDWRETPKDHPAANIFHQQSI